MSKMTQTVESAPLTVVSYKWELANIPSAGNITILSKMIKFLGEKAFRVGFKPHPFSTTTPPTVLFMTSNLNKVGIKVFKVLFCDGFTSKFKQMDLDTRNGDVTGCLQLFTASFNSFRMLESVLVRQYPRRLIFEIHFTGIVENYQFKERDCLLKNQMWSLMNQVGADFEFVAGGRPFPVHKCILIARSPYFAALFSSDTHEQLVKREENVSAASMEQFLQFVYTGELEGPIHDPGLLQLATSYQIKTLESLCRFASHDVGEDEMVAFTMQFRPGASDSQLHITPDDDFEIDPSSTCQVLSLTWNVNSMQRDQAALSALDFATSPPFEYQKKNLFRARIEILNQHPRQRTVTLLVYQHRKINCQVRQVACSIFKGDRSPGLDIMSERTQGDEKLRQVFSIKTTEMSTNLTPPFSVTFHIKLSGMVANFDRKLMDSTCGVQLWAASINKQQTDVEFLVGDEAFSAHRRLLSTRSPVFEAMFTIGMEEATSGKVFINDVDPGTFRDFLEFLYTGMVMPSSRNAKLFAVADKYQVETLMELCRPATQPALDIDDFTRAFLSC